MRKKNLLTGEINRPNIGGASWRWPENWGVYPSYFSLAMSVLTFSWGFLSQLKNSYGITLQGLDYTVNLSPTSTDILKPNIKLSAYVGTSCWNKDNILISILDDIMNFKQIGGYKANADAGRQSCHLLSTRLVTRANEKLC